MKSVELSDQIHAALSELARRRNQTPAELITALVSGVSATRSGDQLLLLLTGEEFTRRQDPIDRYLALLAWCARTSPTDFADFVSHQESGRHYLAWNREEINEARARNLARQIDGTQFWAVMTIDDGTRRRFVCRLLEFIGCHDDTIALACQALGLSPAGMRLLSA